MINFYLALIMMASVGITYASPKPLTFDELIGGDIFVTKNSYLFTTEMGERVNTFLPSTTNLEKIILEVQTTYQDELNNEKQNKKRLNRLAHEVLIKVK